MTNKHTPGPWGIREGFDKEEIEIFQIDKHVEPPFYPMEICSVKWIDDQDANARLIAAAPDLLEALKVALRQNSLDMIMTDEELRQCYAVIRKATGEGHD